MPKVLSLLICLPLLAAAQVVQITSSSIQAIGSATIAVTRTSSNWTWEW